MAVQIKSTNEFDELIKSMKLTVVDFHASWCGPCHAIAPTFTSLAQRYPNVQFAKVDVDQIRDVAAAQGVTAMPTFQFFKSGKQIDEMKGANRQMLENKVQQHAGSSGGTAFTGQGQTLGKPSSFRALRSPEPMISTELKKQLVYFVLFLSVLIYYRYINK